MPSLRGLLNRTVVLNRPAVIGRTGGGQPIYGELEMGLLKARIELAGLGGRSIAPTEVQSGNNEAIVADYHAVTALRLELQPVDPLDPLGPKHRPPANLGERDELIGEDGIYEILAVATADGRSRAHHYECKLRKVTP